MMTEEEAEAEAGGCSAKTSTPYRDVGNNRIMITA